MGGQFKRPAHDTRFKAVSCKQRRHATRPHLPPPAPPAAVARLSLCRLLGFSIHRSSRGTRMCMQDAGPTASRFIYAWTDSLHPPAKLTPPVIHLQFAPHRKMVPPLPSLGSGRRRPQQTARNGLGLLLAALLLLLLPAPAQAFVGTAPAAAWGKMLASCTRQISRRSSSSSSSNDYYGRSFQRESAGYLLHRRRSLDFCVHTCSMGSWARRRSLQSTNHTPAPPDRYTRTQHWGAP